MGNDLFEPELVKMGDNDMLKKQLIRKQLVSPNIISQ
jgi:hypothetical protein